MTGTTVTPSVTAPPSAEVATTGGVLAGTSGLVRFVLRRDGIELSAWTRLDPFAPLPLLITGAVATRGTAYSLAAIRRRDIDV